MTSELVQLPGSTVLPHGPGRGPGGQPSDALPNSVGRCAVPGCDEQIDRSRLMCRRDWYQLPKQLRDRIWATWRSGRAAASPEHLRAVQTAIRFCQMARAAPWRRPFLRLLLGRA